MKKLLTGFVILLAILCFSLTSCKEECQHEFCEDGICINCSYGKVQDTQDNNLFTVTFDTSGGSKIDAQHISKCDKVSKPEDPEKFGYIFNGWYVNGEKWSFIGYTVTEDITLVADWIPIEHTISVYTYTGEIITYHIPHGASIPQIYPNERDGFTFDGYYYNGKCWDFENGTVLGDMSLIEHWSLKKYSITYILNDSSNSEANPLHFTEQDLPLELKAPTKDNSTFMGWHDLDTGAVVECLTECKNYRLEAVFITYGDRPWDVTTLIYEMTENSNNLELPSTCRRYLAGDTTKLGTENPGIIDKLVSIRNANAEKNAKVKIEYAYIPEGGSNGWGQNIDRINTQVLGQGKSAPDIYCNFVYDMVAASLKSSFANLLSTKMKSYKKFANDGNPVNENDFLTGSDYNYFAFENEINMKDDGKDYMIDYMRSLSLSKYKMYCLSSDYFTDMVRAFLVVPVNIGLLESIKLPAAGTDDGHQCNSDRAKANGQKGQDGKFTIEDFYQLVWDMEWTYETLAAYSKAIYKDTNSAIDGADIKDTLGFALATSSGLSASGMFYSTSITIINCDKTTVTTKGDYSYSYPGTSPVEKNGKVESFEMSGDPNSELITFCDKITALFASDGVLAIGNTTDETQGVAPDALQAIRSRFSTNNVLFGGVICLGSLEYDEYKDMNQEGKKGYGIAPVPLYTITGDAAKDRYQTQIHNLGRIGAISLTTKKFAQCTAYLDYQCTHSTDILNEYYEAKLQYDVVGSGVSGNVKMLNYIRDNVRSSFDKAYEDALGIFYAASDPDANKKIWHYMIKDSGYDFDGADMLAAYNSYAPVKAKRLYDLEYSTFPGLPA